MVEPTETEDRDTLDRFVDVMQELIELAKEDPEASISSAGYNTCG